MRIAREANLFETSHPMLRPLWVRLLICGVTLLWGCFELFMGSVTWAVIFGVVGLICVYHLLIDYVPPEERPDDKRPS